MAKKNRRTLKGHFEEGSLPSADQFGDLIDSTLNLIEEGFDKTAPDGFKISLIGDHQRLISFYRSGDPNHPVWSIEYDENRDRLKIVNPRLDKEDAAAITIDARGRVGVGNLEPRHRLDVGGVVAAEGRLGANPDGISTVPADGQWHDITGELRGCNAIEVMAGVGSPGTGRYALLRAVALNTFNPHGWLSRLFNLKRPIRTQQAYYLDRGNRIKLRWRKIDKDRYTLQMSTACGYGDGINIRFYRSDLWVDSEMECSQQAEGEKL